MPLIQVKFIDEAFTPIEEKRLREQMFPLQPGSTSKTFSAMKWDIGAPAMTIDVIRTLVAGQ